MAAIEIDGVSKRFGSVQAVSDLSFEVEAGRVTGFLGPNGAGKSTTLRMLLGLVHADGGSASFDGSRFEDLPHPSAEVGAVLEDASFHPGRSGRNHLRILAAAGEPPADSRVDEVLELVGIGDAGQPARQGYSMGMRQRLAIAAALLGDPEVLILDEPANGLDPPGIRWMREMLRSEAARGRAVLVSSHLLSEVSQSVDDIVVISHGKLRASGPLQQVLSRAEGGVTRVRAGDPEALGRRSLAAAGIEFERDRPGALLVSGATPEAVGAAANEHCVALTELVAVARSLEDVFFELTGVTRSEPAVARRADQAADDAHLLRAGGVAIGISLVITILVASITRALAGQRPQRRLPDRHQQPLHHDPRDRRHHRRVAPPHDHQLAARRARPHPFLAAKTLAFAAAGRPALAGDLDRDRDRRLRHPRRARPADARAR